MSSTRHTTDEGQLFENRYASDSAYTSNSGIDATATAKKCKLGYFQGYQVDLMMFLQGLSLEMGGTYKLAQAIIKEFPDRFIKALRTPCAEIEALRDNDEDEFEDFTSPSLRVVTQTTRIPRADWECSFSWNISGGAPIRGMDLEPENRRGDEFCQALRQAWDAKRKAYDPEGLQEACNVYAKPLELFLRELCVNPRLGFYKAEGRAEAIKADQRDRRLAFPQDDPWRVASLPYFYDIAEALLQFVANWKARIQADFILTSLGAAIQKTLSFAADQKVMVMVNGREGRGKTEASKAWVLANLHRARFVKLTADTDKGDFYRAISKACGLPISHSLNPKQMKSRVEEFLQSTKLCLVIDEAHFALGQSKRVYKNPEMMDWIYTALVNNNVPVALVTTPQFNVYMGRVADQMSYNVGQFQRRLKRSIILEEFTKLEDLERIARKMLPGATERGMQAVLSHVEVNRDRDVSGLGDVVREARRLAADRGSETISDADIGKATKGLGLHESRLRGMVQRETPTRSKRRIASYDAAPLQDDCTAPARQDFNGFTPDTLPANRASTSPTSLRTSNSRTETDAVLVTG